MKGNRRINHFEKTGFVCEKSLTFIAHFPCLQGDFNGIVVLQPFPTEAAIDFTTILSNHIFYSSGPYFFQIYF